MRSKVDSPMHPFAATSWSLRVRGSGYGSVAVPLVGALILVLAEWRTGFLRLTSETPLVMLTLISYLSGSLLFILYLAQRERLLERLGLFVCSLGLGLNLAAWGMRWVITGTVPLSNLYDTALIFAGGTTLSALVVSTRYHQKIIGAVTLPIATLLVVWAVLYGGEVVDLPPVLRSTWRPIHVGLAMSGYAVAALSCISALLYLLKAGVAIEAVGLPAMLFVVGAYAFVSGGTVVTDGVFTLPVSIHGARIPLDATRTEFLRATIPYAGRIFQLAFGLAVIAAGAFLGYVMVGKDLFKRIGHGVVRGALVVEAVGLGLLFYQVSRVQSVVTWLDPQQRGLLSDQWLQRVGAQMDVQFHSDPIAAVAVTTACGLTAFIAFFGWRGDQIIEALPSPRALDNLTYRAVTVAFPLLTLMVITGAVWANESWGRYWGWDPKETWALITWLVYGAYLHMRITHGWKGRRSALFAVLGFVAVLFTYLGVSFILPGLHSYA